MRTDWFGLLRAATARYGDAFALRFGPRRVAVFNDPALAEAVLIGQADAFDKGPTLRRAAGRFVGDGLITVGQADHARLRALVAPAFAPRRVDASLPGMRGAAEAATAALGDGDVVDLQALLLDVTTRGISSALFSDDLGRPREAALRDALDALLTYVSRRVQQPLSVPWGWPSAANRAAWRARRELRAIVAALIAERRARGAGPAGGGGGDILDQLLAAQARGLGEAELIDQIATLYFAGFETTASTLTWTLALVEAHGYADALAAADDADPLVDALLSEAMRLYPAAHTLGREALRSVAVGGYRVERGALLLVSPWLLHRRALSFADPDAFDPGRWARSGPASLPRCAYLPFGAGPRACLGGQFARQQMRVVLTTWARRWRWQPLEAALPAATVGMTLRPQRYLVRVTARRGASA